MTLSLVLVGAQFAFAFFVVDWFFRTMDVSPGGFAMRVRTYAWRYAVVGALFCIGSARVQWLAGGWPGVSLAPLNAVPWWLLWRFGLRKQLTFLFKDDGGRPLERKNPDL